MKLYAIALIGSLATLPLACHIDVDDYCGDDDDWDNDDEPCETHIHADTTDGSGSGTGGATVTTTTSGSTGAGGGASAGSDGSSASGGTGGTNSSGTSASSGGASNGSATSAGATAGEAGSGSNGLCEDCMPLPDGASCLWGTTEMDSCCGVDVLVDVAAEECDAFGLVLSDFTLEQACAGGHEQVSYQCCREDASRCSDEQISLDACVSENVLATLAEQVCSDAGQAVSSMSVGDACGDDTYQSLDVTCCVMD